MNQDKRSRSRIDSFRNAFAGIRHVLGSQENARIHAVITVIVIGLALWLRLRLIEWALLALAIGLVWLTEIVNTALEAAVDVAQPGVHPLAAIAKDAGAAAVLVSALIAAVVGGLVLGPPLLRQFGLLLP